MEVISEKLMAHGQLFADHIVTVSGCLKLIAYARATKGSGKDNDSTDLWLTWW